MHLKKPYSALRSIGTMRNSADGQSVLPTRLVFPYPRRAVRTLHFDETWRPIESRNGARTTATKLMRSNVRNGENLAVERRVTNGRAARFCRRAIPRSWRRCADGYRTRAGVEVVTNGNRLKNMLESLRPACWRRDKRRRSTLAVTLRSFQQRSATN